MDDVILGIDHLPFPWRYNKTDECLITADGAPVDWDTDAVIFNDKYPTFRDRIRDICQTLNSSLKHGVCPAGYYIKGGKCSNIYRVYLSFPPKWRAAYISQKIIKELELYAPKSLIDLSVHEDYIFITNDNDAATIMVFISKDSRRPYPHNSGFFLSETISKSRWF